jgi:hypothetical protein
MSIALTSITALSLAFFNWVTGLHSDSRTHTWTAGKESYVRAATEADR